MDSKKPIRFEAGKKLNEAEKKEMYKSLKDSYRENNRPYTIEDDKLVWLDDSAPYMTKSDVTGRMLRWYIILPDGKIAHPTEVFGASVQLSDLERVQKNIESNEFWAKKYYDEVSAELEKKGETEKVVDAINKAKANGAELKGEYSSDDVGKRHKRVRLVFGNGNNVSVPEYVINIEGSYLGLTKEDWVKQKIGEGKNRFLHFNWAEIDWEKFHSENFNWLDVFRESTPEEEAAFKLKQETEAKNEKENWYQQSKWSKKYAPTYKDAVEKMKNEYLDAKKSLEDWGSRVYKSNKGVVYAGGDDIHGEAYTIGGINEHRKKNRMMGAKMQMDEAIANLKELGVPESEINELIEQKEMISNSTEEILQKKKANELREELLKNGFYVNQPNTSITNFGVSTYIGFYDEFDVYRKFRISDHSVTNTHRIWNEYHYNQNSDVSKIVEQVKKDIEETKQDVSIKTDLHNKDRERTKLANEKWERVKDKFKDLCFKTNSRTYQDLSKFSENKNRTNIYQKALDNNRYGETPYYYEWTEPKNQNEYCTERPSREYIENFITEELVEQKENKDVMSKIKGITEIEYEDDGKTIIYGSKNNKTRISVKNMTEEDIKEEFNFEKKMLENQKADLPNKIKNNEYVQNSMSSSLKEKDDSRKLLDSSKKNIEILENIVIPFYDNKLKEFKIEEVVEQKENKEMNEEIKLIDTIKYNVDGEAQLKEIYQYGDSNIQLLYTSENKKLFQIAGLFVQEKDRRSGIGSRLIDFAKSRAAELGFDEILYLVADYEGKDYDDLVSFVKKNGFEFVGDSNKKMIFKLSKENKEMENIKLKIQEYLKSDAILTKKLNGKISDSEFSKIQEIRSENGKKLMKHFVNHFNLEKGQVYEYKQNKEQAKYNKLKYMALLAIHMDNFIEFDYFDENLKRVENESYERFYSKDLMRLFDLFSENKITLLNNYNYVKTSEQTGEYQIIAPPKELTEDEKKWASITDKFHQVYFEDSSSENNTLTSDQVKATEYAWQFDKYSKYKSTLSWDAAEKKFKDSLTKEELDSIEISYKKDKYADLEQHDTEKYHIQIFVKQKATSKKVKEGQVYLNTTNNKKVQIDKVEGNEAEFPSVYYHVFGEEKSYRNSNIDRLSLFEDLVEKGAFVLIDSELEKGKAVEMEHKKTLEKVATGEITPEEGVLETAETHIAEDPKYYDKLEQIEKPDTEELNSFKKRLQILLRREYSQSVTDKIMEDNKFMIEDDFNASRSVNLVFDRLKDAHEKPQKDKYNSLINNAGINSERVDNWNQVPVVWKNTKPISKVNFVNTPYNKELIKLLDTFAGNDALRPVMSGIHFDGNGITATNAHKLITLPYPNPEYNGTYATIPKRDYSQDKDIKKDLFVSTKYPNYEAVTPKAENATDIYEFSVYKALQYTRVALKFANKVTNQIAFSFGDTLIAFNGEFLSDLLETALKLGHTKLFSFTTAPNRAIVLSPDRNYEIGKSEIFLLMPVIINNDEENYKGGAMDLDFNREIKVYYDFATDSIYNSNGTIAEFKMNYGEYDILKPNEIKALDKYAGNNNTIPVLDNFKVEEGKVFANNLETSFTIKDSDLKDGLYRVINGAIEYNANDTLSSFDDFPKIKIEGDLQLGFVINSEILKFYIEKAIEFTGDDDLRPIMKGICFDYNNGQMFMVATDAHKLFKVEITEYIETNAGQKDFQFILSQINLMKFLKVLDESPIEVKAYNKNVVFDTDDYNFVSKTIDGRYPNYNAVISTFKNKKITINVKDLFICLKSKEAQDFIKKHKKEDVMLIDRAGSKENELDLYLFVFEDTRDNSSRKIEDEVKICTVKYKYEEGTYQTQSNVILLMPIMNNEDAAHFAFREKFFREILDVVNCEDVEIFYDEKNRAYLIDGDCFKYKHTIQAVKKSPVKTSVVEEVRTEKEIIEQEEKDKEVIEEQFNEPDADLIDRGTTGTGTSDAEDAIVLLNDLLEDAKGKQKKTILEAINLLKDLL